MKSRFHSMVWLLLALTSIPAIAASNDPPAVQYELKVTPHNGATQFLYYSSWKAAESAMISIDASTHYLVPEKTSLSAFDQARKDLLSPGGVQTRNYYVPSVRPVGFYHKGPISD